MAETSLIRHLVAKVTMDTADFAAGSKKAKAELAAMHAAMERFSQAQTGLKEINAEIQKLQKHLALAQHLFGRSDQSKQIAAQIAGLKNQRTELYEILKLEKMRRVEQQAWVARQQASVSGAIASAAAYEKNAPAIPGVGAIQQQSGTFAAALAGVTSTAKLIRGGGILAGVTLLSNSIKRSIDEFARLNAANAGLAEKIETATDRIPVVGAGYALGLLLTGRSSRVASGELSRSQQEAGKGTFESLLAERQLLERIRGRGLEGAELQKLMIDTETESIIKQANALQYLTDRQKEEIRIQAEAVGNEKKMAVDREAEANFYNEQTEEIIRRAKARKEELAVMTDWYESFADALEEINRQWEASDWGRNTGKAIKPEKNPFANEMEAAKLYESTRTASERLQADIERWMDLYNSGELSGEVLSRAISGRLTLPRQATLPDLAVRGSQQAESLISRQMVGKTEKTQEEMLKEIMKIVRESKSSADLLRQIEKKLGGVNI